MQKVRDVAKFMSHLPMPNSLMDWGRLRQCRILRTTVGRYSKFVIGYLKGGTKHESIGTYSGLPFVPHAIPSQRETASWIGTGSLFPLQRRKRKDDAETYLDSEIAGSWKGNGTGAKGNLGTLSIFAENCLVVANRVLSKPHSTKSLPLRRERKSPSWHGFMSIPLMSDSN